MQSFTWGSCLPFLFCRLDYWLISDKIHDFAIKVDIILSIKADHSAIFLELEEIKSFGRRAGFWKPNIIKTTVTNNLPIWLDEGKDINGPCDNTRVIMERCKHDLKALYEDKVEGMILRAKAL